MKFRQLSWLMGLVVLCSVTAVSQQATPPPQTEPENLMATVRVGQNQTKATKIADNIYQAIGFGNTFMVTTSAGNVIIDTSMPFNAALHKRLLQAENSGPIKYIILTHAHGDHTGGIPVWKQPGTQTIAPRQSGQKRRESSGAARCCTCGYP